LGFITSPNKVNVKRRVYLVPIVGYETGRAAALQAMEDIKSTLDGLDIEVQVMAATELGELGIAEAPSLPSTLIDTGNTALNSTDHHVNSLRPNSVAVIIGQFIEDAITPVSFELELERDASGDFDPCPMIDLRNDTRRFVLIPLDDGTQFVSATVSGGGHSVNLDAAKLYDLSDFSTTLTIDLYDVLDQSSVLTPCKSLLGSKLYRVGLSVGPTLIIR
jgi:hypothetical protein